MGSVAGEPDVGDARIAGVGREDRGSAADAPDPGARILREVWLMIGTVAASSMKSTSARWQAAPGSDSELADFA